MESSSEMAPTAITRPLFGLTVSGTTHAVMLRNAANHDQILLPLFTSEEYAELYAQREAKPPQVLILDTWDDILAFVKDPPIPGPEPIDIDGIVIDRIDRKLGGFLFERQSFIAQIKQTITKDKADTSTNQGMNGSGDYV